MIERFQELPIEERINQSPIHQWASFAGVNVDGKIVYSIQEMLEEANVPEELHKPFHEILIERGKYPWDMPDEKVEKFAQETRYVSVIYTVFPTETKTLINGIYEPLIKQWTKFITTHKQTFD